MAPGGKLTQLLANLESGFERLDVEPTRGALIEQQGSVTRIQFPTGSQDTLLWLIRVAMWTVVGIAAIAMFRADSWLFVVGCLAVIAAGIWGTRYARGEEIVVSPTEVAVYYGRGLLRRAVRIPLRDIRKVAVEAIIWADWDLYVLVETEAKSYQLAWSVVAEQAHKIADIIKRAAGLPG